MLTPRQQQQVLEMYRQHMSREEIASAIGCQPRAASYIFQTMMPAEEKAAIMASRRQPPRRPARKGRKVDPDTVITEGHNLCHR
jgi:hypothetical protein